MNAYRDDLVYDSSTYTIHYVDHERIYMDTITLPLPTDTSILVQRIREALLGEDKVIKLIGKSRATQLVNKLMLAL